jgi:EAL domain-containing protein (putative c-di-GMP-specific phosphodiesterase class I)
MKATISLAHSLQLKVVAEGVETAQQLGPLRELGCDQFKGFYRSAAVLPGESRNSSQRLSKRPLSWIHND